MPHIKYYGGDAPSSSISDHVYYRDPAEPCFQGLRTLRVSIWTRCEAAGIPRTEWDKHFREHVQEAPYEGMKHVGGVGVLSDTHLRSQDVVISLEAYEQLKGIILLANEAYKKRLVELLEKENDPSRRANAQDESLGWRTRVWLVSYTELILHARYRVDDSCRAYARILQHAPNGMTLQLVDLYHKCERDIGLAILDGLERAERFADLLALAGFGAAAVSAVVGTSPPVGQEGSSFQVATLQAHIMNSSVEVPPESLDNVTVDEASHLALRHLRNGLSASLPTTAFASFWNTLECQADALARETGLRRTVRCSNCGQERQAGWDLKKGFEIMYANAGIADADFDRHRSLRGRVQHGDEVFSTSAASEILPEVSRLQAAAIASVGKRTGLLPQTGTYQLTSAPIAIFDCVLQGDTWTVTPRSFQIPVVAGILPMRASENRDRTFAAGLKLPPVVDPLVFPPIEGLQPLRAAED